MFEPRYTINEAANLLKMTDEQILIRIEEGRIVAQMFAEIIYSNGVINNRWAALPCKAIPQIIALNEPGDTFIFQPTGPRGMKYTFPAQLDKIRILTIKPDAATIEEAFFFDPQQESGTVPAPAAKVEALPVTTSGQVKAPVDGVIKGLGKRECQIRVIEYFADQQGYQRLSIPYAGKKSLMEVIRPKYPNLFGASDHPFEGAWKEALKQNRIKMTNHDLYGKNK